jgi:hypothetical protein
MPTFKIQKGRSKGGLFVGVIATGDLSLPSRRLCGQAGSLCGEEQSNTSQLQIHDQFTSECTTFVHSPV